MMSADPRTRPVYQKPADRKPTTAPAGWVGVKSGDISIEAEQPTRRAAQDGAAWKLISGLGLSGDSIALLPTQVPVTTASRLEYDFTTDRQGSANVLVYCVPTHMVHDGLHVRYAISIDGGPSCSVDLETKEFSGEWAENVLHATAIGETMLAISTGKHTLTLTPLDPGLVFDKIVIKLAR